MGRDGPLLAPRPCSATDDNRSGRSHTQIAGVFSLTMELTSWHASCSYMMTATWRAIITDIPVKIFTDRILPFFKAKEALSLGCTNKFFALVTTDEAFWRQKVAADYNFTGSETARTSNWKTIYRGFRNPRVFVWGCVIILLCYAGVNSFIYAFLLTRPVIIKQSGEYWSTWVSTTSKDYWLVPGRFSDRTSPSRCPRGQSGNNQLVSKFYS